MAERAAWRRQVRALARRSPALDQVVRRIRRTDEVAALQSEVRALRATLEAHEPDDGVTRIAVPASVAPFLTDNPPGHFYSAVPDLADIERHAGWLFGPRRLPGVRLNTASQLELFSKLAPLAAEERFAETPGDGARYGLANTNYGIGDASMLVAMLRQLRPRHYLEVGSGFTTALALDVNERHLDGQMAVTAIEPYPAMMRSLLRPGDPVEVVAQPVQTVPLARFAALEANDVLFIDCSHVLKTGSDAQFLYGEVLPILRPGVHVHIHDIFWPFEYLRHWVESGRAWNESYLLQAFLAFNDAFEIALWNHYLACEHEAAIAAALPRMLENPGGAIWLRRTGVAPVA